MKSRKFIGRTFDHFDKLRAYYLDGKQLNEVLEKRRLQYEQVHQLRLAGYSTNHTIKILIKKGVIPNTAEGYRICHNAEKLFGDVAAANKEGLRVILTENFFRLYKKSLKTENLKEANRALENIAKINSLVNNENTINWNEIIIPVPVYTTKTTALQNHNNFQDAEVID